MRFASIVSTLALASAVIALPHPKKHGDGSGANPMDPNGSGRLRRDDASVEAKIDGTEALNTLKNIAHGASAHLPNPSSDLPSTDKLSGLTDELPSTDSLTTVTDKLPTSEVTKKLPTGDVTAVTNKLPTGDVTAVTEKVPTDKLTSVTESLPVDLPAINKVETMTTRDVLGLDVNRVNEALNTALSPLNNLFALVTPQLTIVTNEINTIVNDNHANIEHVMTSSYKILTDIKPQVEEISTDINNLDLNALKDKISTVGVTGNQAIVNIEQSAVATEIMLKSIVEDTDKVSGLGLAAHFEQVDKVKALAGSLLAKIHSAAGISHVSLPL